MTHLRLPCIPRPGPIVWSILVCLLLTATGASASAADPPPGAPAIQSESESDIAIGVHGATLEAQVATNGLETEYQLWIECGVGLFQCGSPELVAGGKIQAGTPSQSVSASVEGLTSGDRYKYWAIATNPDGTSTGPTRIFQPDEAWPGPMSETDTATELAENEATLAGRIYPTAREPGEFAYFFEYGPTASYGTSAPDAPGATLRIGSCGIICASEATEPEPVSVQVSGLAPATVYHYRLVATSAGGYRQFGQDAIFTTPAQSLSPSEPVETLPGTGAGQADPSAPLGTALLSSPAIVTALAPSSKHTALEPSSAKLLARALSVCRSRRIHRSTCLRRAYRKYGRAARRLRG
jgi:hypothetical protein